MSCWWQFERSSWFNRHIYLVLQIFRWLRSSCFIHHSGTSLDSASWCIVSRSGCKDWLELNSVPKLYFYIQKLLILCSGPTYFQCPISKVLWFCLSIFHGSAAYANIQGEIQTVLNLLTIVSHYTAWPSFLTLLQQQLVSFLFAGSTSGNWLPWQYY